jgi:hypothetical protein
MSWTAQASDGNIHRYEILGVKGFDEVQDDVSSTFVWLWSIKDHMQKLAITKGFSSRWLEAEVGTDVCLSVCADIANREKHGTPLKYPRSGKDPRLGQLSYTIPQEAIAKITVTALGVQTDVSDVSLVTFEIPVLDGRGHKIGDAFHYLSAGIKRWETLMLKLQSA